MNWSKTRLEAKSKRVGCSGLVRCGTLLLIAAVGLGMAGQASATKFMPTGNSITQGQGSTSGLGFRDLLLTSLDTIGTFDFVGAPDSPNGAAPYEGHFYGGAQVGEFLAGQTHDIAPTMSAETPEILAIHLGTNDVNSLPGPYGPWSNDHATPNTSNPTGRLGSLIDYALSFGSVTQVIVSRIIPIENRDDDIEVFNREVVRMVLDYRNGAVTGSQEPVYLSDHYLRFLSNPNLYSEWMDPDGLHPQDAGYSEMETVYLEAVDQALNDGTPPAPVADLGVGTVSGESILLVWTNTGDDGGTGHPRYADCRYSTGAITAVNFKTQNQAGDYRLIGNGGEVTGVRISNLSTSQNYTLAVKLMDDGSNLSTMSNTATSGTLADADVYRDSFTRSMSDPGPDWASDAFSTIGNELVNTSGVFATTVFTAVTDAASAQFVWGAAADPAGIEQAGIACRLEGSDPSAVDGYIAYRNTSTATLTLREIVNGNPMPAVLDNVLAQQPVPGAGDEMKVVLSSDGSGHHFAIYINGLLDGILTDANKLRGNGTYYCGVITDGGFNNPIDDWEVGTITTNLPPVAFSLLSPADGSDMPNLHPILDWEEAPDPNGDPVTYELHLSTDPGFPAGQTTITETFAATTHAFGAPLPANTTYHWQVKAEDSFGQSRFSSEVWSFNTGDFQQVLDDFERPSLGGDWAADPSYSIVSGEISCTAPGFNDIAIYAAAVSPVAVEWEWSETATTPGAGVAGCLIGMDAAATDASGYFVFRNTSGAERWSVFEIVNGQLGASLSIDQDGANPLPGPGDRIRVVLVKEPTAHHFECYVNDVFGARMTDTQRLQGAGSTTYAGLLLGNNTDNNIENFTVMGSGLNMPPAAFSLIEPSSGTVIFSLAPAMRWEEALDPNPGDVVTYTVIYDTVPEFTNPQSLPPVTIPETTFRGSLEFNETYYWRVRASDTGGAEVMSNETWSFITAPVLSFVDDFNRASLGPDWSGDAVMQIVNDELANTATNSSFDLAVYNPVSDPDAVRFTWSPTANLDGIRRGGLALMLDGVSGTASGYWVSIDPFSNEAKLDGIVNGGIGPLITSAPGQTTAPGPGSMFKAEISSDIDGHHFDVFVDDVFHSRVTDGAKSQGNGPTLYSGVALRGGNANNCDNFTMTSFPAAPNDFALLQPAFADTGVAYQPTFSWTSGGPGIVYTLYLGADSTFAAADSMIAITDTTAVWPTALPHATEHFWRVRATDGMTSLFNTTSWYAFTTTVVVTVELASFEAEAGVGGVSLRWTTSREHDHVGFHVWRAETEEGSYSRLTGPQMVTGSSPYTYVDRSGTPGETYYYRLEAVDNRGESQFFGPVVAGPASAPRELALYQNVPNPFNPSTTITFDLPRRDRVQLLIFDLSGRLVRELVSQALDPGSHAVIWNGRDNQGIATNSGIYFARLNVGEWSSTRKLLLVR